MASWLKATEDLFEVVDRRAKLVVNELADEQSDLQTPASNGQGSQAKKIKSRIKAQRRHSADESLKINDTPRKQTNTQASQVDVTCSKDRAALAVEKETIPTGNTQKNSEQQSNNERDASSIPSTEPAEDVTKHDADEAEVPATVTDTDTAISTSNGELLKKIYSNVHVEHPPSPLPPKEKEIVNEDHSDDAGQITKSENVDILLKIDNETQVTDPAVSSESLLKDAYVLDETPANKKNEQELKADDPPTIVQDQLDKAQGLLKTAISTGQSKEARLARVCAGLSSRLQEYKSENAQLEELLVAERELSRSYEAHIKQLQQELSVSKSEVMKVESNLAEALAAKNSEIEKLVNSIDTLMKQAALSEGNLASLQSLREELASAERRAEEEHAAHNATKMAAMKREVELEHTAVEASTALARIQRIVDERTAKAGDLEQKVAMLEVECTILHQELQDMEARVKRGQKKSPEEANQLIQMQAWQEEVERACQGKRDAESKLSSLEAEVQKMRVEMAAMKRDAEHYSREEHMELEKRYRELTDLLYYKQTQLETLASEKAAAEFQLEKEVKRLQEAQVGQREVEFLVGRGQLGKKTLK